MSLDKGKLLKQDNKQFGRKSARFFHLNQRFLLLSSLFIITFIFVTLLNVKLQQQSLHQYVNKFFLRSQQSSNENENYIDQNDKDFDLIWDEKTVELFQEQLGIIVDSEAEAEDCHLENREFIVTALPGYNPNNIYQILWQYISLIALESQIIQSDNYGREYSMKAFVTENMRVMLNQLFEGNLPLELVSNLQSSCYNLKYSKIIGNNSPIDLKEIKSQKSILMLDPAAKRYQEIAEFFTSKTRQFFRFKKEIMEDVGQEFLVTRTIHEKMEDDDVNFVGMYITFDDKLPVEYYEKAMTFHRKKYKNVIFMVICDVETLTLCKDTFDNEKSPGDVRILRTSNENFDFALLTSCNTTIVSNDNGALAGLLNGGITTVFHPEVSLFSIPYLLSERISEWNSIAV